ncbi:MAG: hypothetical protein ABIH11_06895 [Candidatus Altiarchaeota archaeon]
MVTTTLTLTLMLATTILTPTAVLSGVLTFGVLIFQMVLLEMATKESVDANQKKKLLLFILTPLLFSFILVVTYGITRI